MPWAKIDDEFHRHPKARAAGLRGRALFVASLCWANAQRTDGHIPDRDLPIVAAEAEVSPATAKKLVDVGLFERVDDGYRVHDFLEHNYSAEQMEERRAKRASAGRIGGIRSGRARRGETSPPEPSARASGEANASASGSASAEAATNPMSHDPCSSKNPPSNNGGTRPTRDDERPDQQPPDLARAVASVLADQQPPGAIRTSRGGWIRATAVDVTARPGWDRDRTWLTQTHPELEQHQVVLALASRHADGHWPSWITPPQTRPDVWAGLPGEPDHDPSDAA